MRGIFISLYFIWNGAMLILLPGNVCAKTLAEVLAVTYRTNPALQSARADLREKDELLAQAISSSGGACGHGYPCLATSTRSMPRLRWP